MNPIIQKFPRRKKKIVCLLRLKSLQLSQISPHTPGPGGHYSSQQIHMAMKRWHCSKVKGHTAVIKGLDPKLRDQPLIPRQQHLCHKDEGRGKSKCYPPTLISTGQPSFSATAPISDTGCARSGVKGPLICGFSFKKQWQSQKLQ